jgi:hypothetical protein
MPGQGGDNRQTTALVGTRFRSANAPSFLQNQVLANRHPWGRSLSARYAPACRVALSPCTRTQRWAKLRWRELGGDEDGGAQYANAAARHTFAFHR